MAVKDEEIAERRFTRTAISEAIGMIEKIRPNKMYRGDPGGCGTPRI